MQKSKPYRCDACGKRYKNLNGLKYHKNHSAACEDGKPFTEPMDTTSTAQPNPLPPANPPNFAQGGFNPGNNNMSGMGMGMGAGGANGFPLAGLPGIDEEMIM